MAGQVTLADGHCWEIRAADAYSAHLVTTLTAAMQCRPVQPPQHRIIVHTHASQHPDVHNHAQRPETTISSETHQSIHCAFPPAVDAMTFARHLRQLALIMARTSQRSGGLLVHGALVALDERGVILAGPPGIGKTTACQRIPAPWRVCSDDLTLIVRDRHGMYWAHPWPTWSRFLHSGVGGSWNVQAAVRLQAICFVTRAGEDTIEPLGRGRAACFGVKACEQAGWGMPSGLPQEDQISMRTQCFQTICALTTTLPCYLLRLSLHGRFWLHLEQMLAS